MWKKQRTGEQDSLEKALGARLDALERKVGDQERVLKSLELEWNNVLDKLNRIMGRINARSRRDLEPPELEEAAPAAPAQFNLLEAQRELARRRGSNGVLRGSG